jgi:hypothetical protein
MIDYNLVLYIGIGLIVFGFVLFLVSAHFEREAEIKLFKLKQLDKAFNKGIKKMSDYNWCHNPDCHKIETQSRVRGTGGTIKY